MIRILHEVGTHMTGPEKDETNCCCVYIIFHYVNVVNILSNM